MASGADAPEGAIVIDCADRTVMPGVPVVRDHSDVAFTSLRKSGAVPPDEAALAAVAIVVGTADIGWLLIMVNVVPRRPASFPRSPYSAPEVARV